MCPIRFLSTLPPYSRKPSPFGPNMSVCAKGVSRGVHNIAFSVSPDRFRAFDSFFFFFFFFFFFLLVFFFFFFFFFFFLATSSKCKQDCEWVLERRSRVVNVF